ncbi:MAG: DUF3619 family protein [Methylophilaceae bacterium]|jgi:hypothetical protein|nr:DUF3619 family protein [Methylophilaceae bacterium]
MMKINTENQQTELRDQALAKCVVTLLNEQAMTVDTRIASQLSYSRQQALANMAMPSSGMTISQNGVLRLFRNYWHQYSLLLTLLMCGLGLLVLLAMQNMANQEEAEQGDAYLLASDLPPEIYSNEGFGTWLSENTQQ